MKRFLSLISAVSLAVILVATLSVILPKLPQVSATYTYFFNSTANGFPGWTQSSTGVFRTLISPYNQAGEIKMTVNIGNYDPNDPPVFEAVFASTQSYPTQINYQTPCATVVEATPTSIAVNACDSNGDFVGLGSATVNVHDGSQIRAVERMDGVLAVWLDNTLVLAVSTQSSNGYMGFSQYSGGNGTGGVSEVDLGNLDTIAPNQIPASSVGVSAFPSHVDLQWPAGTDDPSGTGVALYKIYRNSQLLTSTTNLSYSDTTVLPSANYTYTLTVEDYHLNTASTNINVTTPHVVTNGPFPSSIPDGRRVGVRPTAAYWGSSNEQIDVMSGNMNFTIPLLTAMQRGGASVPFNLIYNSQVWRQDSGGTWQYGRDSGFGYGWQLMAGSITPVFSDPYTISYYLFSDATGSQYRLDQNNNNVWSSKESVYVSFDANANILYFPNGSRWVFACISAGNEADSGVMYPTMMEDRNGNQIMIRYNSAQGANWTNSSSRISEIEDVRAVDNGSGDRRTYAFAYSGTPPHLGAITNTIGSSESYNLAYTTATLVSPFSPSISYGTTTFLDVVQTSGVNTEYVMGYTSPSNGTVTGELWWVNLPYGGSFAYGYDTVSYSSGVSYREVSFRDLTKSGNWSDAVGYGFSHESTPGQYVRQFTIIDDPGGVGEKYWSFGQSGVTQGLVTTYQGRSRPGPVTLQESDLTWTQDSLGNSYIGTSIQKMDPGQSYEADKRVDQTLDTNGNVTQVSHYDFGNLTTPSRVYNYQYVTASPYPALHINNLLTVATVTSGGTTTQLAFIGYDQVPLAYAAPRPSYEWDSSLYTTGTGTRGNATTVTNVDSSASLYYDEAGSLFYGTQAGVTMNVTMGGGSYNYAVPTALNVGSVTQTMAYNSALAPTSTTGANTGDTTTVTYDAYNRPSGTTSPFGASSTITYSAAPYSSSAPAIVTTTINGRWTRNTLDGLGRTIKTETGNGGTTTNSSETTYDSCGCTPIGKLKSQTLPHAPGAANPTTTTYTYDGIGRTLQVQTVGTESGGSTTTSTTTFQYQGNTVTVMDAMGKWKKFTRDSSGNLTQVNEPNPAGGADYVTTYTYDVLDNLAGVSMARPSGTQTRSFTYNGHKLASATNPENGTVTNTYNSYNTIATQHDAKGQDVVYTYDTMARLTEVQRYPNGQGNAEDTCQREFYYYDTNPFNSSFSQNATGRMTATQYYGGPSCNTTFTEMYSYNAGGAKTAKQVQIARTGLSSAVLEADYSFDNEGRTTAIQYPSSTLPSTAGAPTFSPAPGTYSSSQNVTLSSSTSGATIRYTTDGSTPSETNGTVYSAPVAVPSVTTIKAIAYKSGLPDSSVTAGTYSFPASGPAWYNSSWTYRKAITISHSMVSGSSNLTNFPVLISLTSDTDLQAHAQANGNDLLFTDSSGAAKLNHEIESYSNGTLVAWVQIPTLSPSADTAIYVYYGNPAATNQQNSASVWNSNYLAVQHFPSSTTLTAHDSTANGNNGTLVNNPVATSGKIGGAAAFTAANSQYIQNTTLGVPAGSDVTISFWANITSAQATATCGSAFTVGGSDAPNRIQAHAPWCDNNIYWDYGNYGSGGRVSTSYAWHEGSWTYVTLVAKGNNTFQAIYLNGSNVASQNSGNAPTSTLTGYDIGAWPGLYYNGSMDEFRISNTVLSAAWIATEYNNQNSPSTFYSVGSSQAYTGGGTPQVIAPTFSVAPGSYSSTQSVSLSTTSSATIRYTLDGTNPTESLGFVYSGAITVSNSTAIKAIAYASGMTDSQITTAAYVIGSTVAPGPHLGVGYDIMGRSQTVTDLATNAALISGATYGPASQLLSITGLINETRGYNSLNQLTSLVSSNASGTAVNLTYAFSSAQNNGKITSMTDNISGEQVVYTYDALNRLASAAATNSSWGQSYSYDGFGNLTDQTVTAGSAPAYHVVYNAATNRQTADCADANGNINSSAGGCGSASYNYDVANRIASSATANQWQYSYSPTNERVWRGVWTGSTLATDEVTFWSAGGAKLGTWALSASGSQLIATMTSSNYYFAGRLIKNNVGYDAIDQLGSVGKFYPYGQEKPSATTNGTEKFTGYFRDAETGNDYAINRYPSPGAGRFLSVDPSDSSFDPNNPVSWNRYGYALGDPVNNEDPLGLAALRNCAGGPWQFVRCETQGGEQGAEKLRFLDCPPNVSLCVGPPPSRGGNSGDGPPVIGDRGVLGGMGKQKSLPRKAKIGQPGGGSALAPNPTPIGVIWRVIARAKLGLGVAMGVFIMATPTGSSADFPPAPFWPPDEVTEPEWQWDPDTQTYSMECDNGETSTLWYDNGVKTGESPHWDYKDCDGHTWKIWHDGTMSPSTERHPAPPRW
jgi:RHS repeat-associated protein